MSHDPIETAILDLVHERGPEKSVDPSEAARKAWPEDWQNRMKQVRNAAVGLARKGQITILRKGKPADPDTFKGVYRLTLPRQEGGDDG